MAEGSLKAVLVALAANVGIAAAKFLAFAVTGSAAILAEAFHSVADTTDQVLLLVGRHRGEHGETPEHPFGFGRERYFWAFFVAILIFLLGAVVAGFEGVGQLRDPQPLTEPLVAVVILVVALGLDAASLRTAARQANRERRGSWWDYVRRAKSAEVPVILLEDSAAVTGVFVALAAIGLTALTGDPRFDAAGSLVIALLLAAMAAVLFREMRSLLIGEAASPERQSEIRAAVEGHEAVRRVVYLRTLHLGPDDILVEAKVELDPTLGSRDVALVIDEVEAEIRGRVEAARVISIEPDVPRETDPDTPDWMAVDRDGTDRRGPTA